MKVASVFTFHFLIHPSDSYVIYDGTAIVMKCGLLGMLLGFLFYITACYFLISC
jgi:hypothetical protein